MTKTDKLKININNNEHSNRTNARLIKDNKITIGSTIKLIPKEQDTNHGEESINPIVENDRVVGVIYKCKCGRQRRILFEYDK